MKKDIEDILKEEDKKIAVIFNCIEKTRVFVSEMRKQAYFDNTEKDEYKNNLEIQQGFIIQLVELNSFLSKSYEYKKWYIKNKLIENSISAKKDAKRVLIEMKTKEIEAIKKEIEELKSK